METLVSLLTPCLTLGNFFPLGSSSRWETADMHIKQSAWCWALIVSTGKVPQTHLTMLLLYNELSVSYSGSNLLA